MRLQFICHGEDNNIHPYYVKERKAITELKNNSEITIKKADKGTFTVIMHKQEKAKKGHVLLDDRTTTHPSQNQW